MGKGLRKRKNGSGYDGRAVMTGRLLKLPLINALQSIEEQRRRPQHPSVFYTHPVLSYHFISFTCVLNNNYSFCAFVFR